ncbi:putative baseplate assembly protein [Nostoc parmelioides]|uniref:Baseplate assembly protein n=1 Tax=Nostoc parmelioides FACHB-3921 TaxID=2692909 RepID=A0ABR8BG01_9NOSO|nr:putative baseplate assembly protein [Nostoc parmelioides]MBD2251977.1 putative baseplate assembly protein [Nostoc parmelioides FACHB-3921]
MSVPPPKIDQRTYDEIVQQTIKLVQDLTTSVEPSLENLRDRTLAETIVNSQGQIIATRGRLLNTSATFTEDDLIKLIQSIKEICAAKNEPTKGKVKVYGWQCSSTPDAGLALIRIFGRMAALVSDRLNQVPEKNFLAFLNLIGARLVPPQPARVPITFYLAEGSTTGAIVPTHTQISAPPADGEEDEVVFETEQELVVTPAVIEAVCVKDAQGKKWSDRTQAAITPNTESFAVFSADKSIETSIYYAFDDIFAISEEKTLLIETTKTTSNNKPDSQEMAEIADWQYWNGEQWESLPSQVDENKKKIPNKKAITKNLHPQSYLVEGQSRQWLKAQLLDSQTLDTFPKNINATLSYSKARPDTCFYNSIPIDFNKDFYLFGEYPNQYDVVYIALGSLPSQGNLTIELIPETKDSNSVTDLLANLNLQWSISKKNSGWIPLKNTKNLQFNEIQSDKSDKIQLSTIGSTVINGEENIWLRAIINSQSNNKASLTFAVLTKPVEAKQKEITVTSVRGFAPGDSIQIRSGDDQETVKISTIKIGNVLSFDTELQKTYSLGATVILQASQSNNLVFSSLKLEYKIEAYYLTPSYYYSDFRCFTEITNATSVLTNTTPSLALYLGFNQSFNNQSTTLFFEVETPKLSENKTVDSFLAEIQSAQFVWEYSASHQTPTQWKEFSVRDSTNNFSQTGLVQFIIPNDFSKASEFGKSLYWLRVSNRNSSSSYNPQLLQILTNTTWASQTLTHLNEMLGSGNGEPGQFLQTSQKPVLSGQQLEVNEGKLPSPEESKQLEAASAITGVYNDTGQLEAVWVRWQEVTNFYASGSRDRHYIFDRQRGTIQFGDAKQGMPPPIGRNNIRMARYQTGGGVGGNRAAQTISQLKTTIPYVDRAVNQLDAAGGSNEESLEQLKEHASKQLRHRNRAVTVQDFEDLAYEASTQVARAKAIPAAANNTFNPLDDANWLEVKDHQKENRNNLAKYNAPEINAGKVTLIVLPHSKDAKPEPSWGFLQQIKTYLQARCAATLDLQVVGPQWVEVIVIVTVIPVDIGQSNALRLAISQRLKQFLHPLTGGFDRKGWEFGRYPQKSSLYRLIEGITEVDHVQELSFDSVTLTPNQLIYSGQHDITCVSDTRS